MKKYVFQVVTPTSNETMNFEELKEKFPIRGWNDNSRQREDLQEQPLLQGLVGPMYNGVQEDGSVVIGYESMKEYLSHD
ncbi:hypothetical protein QTG56_23940 (plasmid) [Rossellomorea sp. AcN35-11]|nr:hypothetical protein [Rossellomorea aquimaris]WJV31690.1 hypothetical protein QTG56_23940 [Rossellomorea sp. AcN35-11]